MYNNMINYIFWGLILVYFYLRQNVHSCIVNVHVDLNKPIHTTSEYFLSVTLDSALIIHQWEGLDFNSKKLEALAKGLSPVILRVGGTNADRCLFKTSHDGGTQDSAQYPTFYITETDWDQMNGFVSRVGWRLLFDLNAVVGTRKHGVWTPTNAKQLFRYSIQKGYTQWQDWELGNEPDLFQSQWNITVSGKQMAADFLRLRRTLREDPEFAAYYRNSILVGPDVFEVGTPIYSDYVDAVDGKLDAVTLHHYYFDGDISSIANFLDPNIFDELKDVLRYAKTTLQKSKSAHRPLWLGETASADHGGTSGLADRYVDGFIWLDELGVAASLGVGVVMRQSLYGRYSLVNQISARLGDPRNFTLDYTLLDDNMDPNPDYWLSYIFKQLVGTRVLNVTSSITFSNSTNSSSSSSNMVRIYAHCTAKRAGFHKGSVTLYGMNLKKHAVILALKGTLRKSQAHVYHFLPYGSKGLRSSLTTINGHRLHLRHGNTLPSLKGKATIVPPGGDIVLKPLSMVFIVLPRAHAPACT